MASQEYRILAVERGRVVGVPLRGGAPQVLRIDHPKRFIENEILVVRAASGGDPLPKHEVVDSRIQPRAFADSVNPVREIGQGSYEFVTGLSEEEEFEFDRALSFIRSGKSREGAAAMREFLLRHPFYVDAYYQLGCLEFGQGHHGRARKYFEQAYRMGRLCLPEGFEDLLLWDLPTNRPYLRALHAFALARERSRDLSGTRTLYEQLIRFNPEDHQGVRYLLPKIYLKLSEYDRLCTLLDHCILDRMNWYSRALAEFLLYGEYSRELLHYFFMGVSYNRFLPELLLGNAKASGASNASSADQGSREEAQQYFAEHRFAWSKTKVKKFVENLYYGSSLRNRLRATARLEKELESLRPGPELDALQDERARVLGPDAVEELVEECLESFTSGPEPTYKPATPREQSVDLEDILKRAGSSAEDSQLQRNASFFSNLVAVATSHPPGQSFLTPFPCRRTEEGHDCSGLVEVFASQVPRRIRWRCTVCDDRGVQRNFVGLPCDLSSRIQPASEIEDVELTTSEYYTLYGNSYLDPRALRTAFTVTSDETGGHVTMKASKEELHYLLGFVAIDANNETDQRRRFEIESLKRALRAYLE